MISGNKTGSLYCNPIRMHWAVIILTLVYLFWWFLKCLRILIFLPIYSLNALKSGYFLVCNGIKVVFKASRHISGNLIYKLIPLQT